MTSNDAPRFQHMLLSYQKLVIEVAEFLTVHVCASSSRQQPAQFSFRIRLPIYTAACLTVTTITVKNAYGGDVYELHLTRH